jgi:transposase
MEAGRLREEFDAGRIDVDRLFDLIESLSRQLEKANQRIAELEKKLGEKPTTKLDKPFSLQGEERRREARSKRRKRKRPKRRGRNDTSAKLAQAERTEPIYPADVPQDDCWLSHTRPVWRLENGRAVLVAYEIYRGPGNRYGTIPAVLGRSEFGIEIMLAIAYQVYVVGLSFDKVAQLFGFFQNLSLRKSQIDAMLGQLSRHWEREIDVLCELLANSMIVHADETSWSINSVWAFVSEKVRLLFFGVHKDEATLRAILNPDAFIGTVVSDDAAVYGNFTQVQKCWAHLLRKAIKLTLVDPERRVYQQFLDGLLAIYREACRVQLDRRLGDEGRRRRVEKLKHTLIELCGTKTLSRSTQSPEKDFRLLVNEVLRLYWADELFTFVTAAAAQKPNGEPMPMPGTNNESERTLRPVANARKTGRTSKTPKGARRQTVITSVIESLRQHLPTFTLATVIQEVSRWLANQKSCFAILRDRLKRAARRMKRSFLTVGTGPPILDRLFPIPKQEQPNHQGA